MGNRSRFSTISLLAGGVALGAVVGVGSVAMTPSGRADIAAGTSSTAVTFGLKRQREPQAGDYWRGCREARASGTAPIYRGEPGYRPEMDGDDDGIACELYRS